MQTDAEGIPRILLNSFGEIRTRQVVRDRHIPKTGVSYHMDLYGATEAGASKP
jgi:hypothetical protein